MLKDLLGSKSLEKILLFLLVHERGYLQEMHRTYKAALTPLQGAAQKLEKAGLLTADNQGKKKLYRLNPSHPLFPELQALLKKAFVHLPTEEKKILFSQASRWQGSIDDHYTKQKQIRLCLEAFRQRLAKVETIAIQTKTHGQAFGKVKVFQENPDVFLFIENGSWLGNPELHFHNTLRWSIDYTSGLIALEHLRYGIDRPIFIFHLTPLTSKTLQSVNSHLCLDDHYFGRIEFTKQHICFSLRILGPKKNESLAYVYS